MPWIGSYIKRDGTKVRGYWRALPGTGRQTMWMGAAVLVVLGAHNGNITLGTGSGEAPQPKSTVAYPITFHTGGGKGTAPTPRPTVSYPIKFPKVERKAFPVPRSTVSYPIRFPSPRSGR